MFHIHDKYISKVFISYFIAALIVFVSIFLAVDFMSIFVKSKTATDVLIEYYVYKTPFFIYQMIPVSCLLATLFSLSVLNKNNELVALHSFGLSLARICAPILIIVSIISVFNFWFGDKIIPKTNQKKNYVHFVKIKKQPGLYTTIKTNKIWYRSKNILFNIQSLNSKLAKAHGLTLYYFDEAWKLMQLVNAKEVSIDGKNWALKKGQVTLFDKSSSFPLTQTFSRKNIIMNENIVDLTSNTQFSDVLSVAELGRFISKNKESGLDTTQFEVDFHSKFGFAFTAFMMTLLAIPFGVSRQRSGGTFKNVGLCMMIIFAYWTLYSSSLALGTHSYLPPMLAAWAPNIIAMGAALYLIGGLKK